MAKGQKLLTARKEKLWRAMTTFYTQINTINVKRCNLQVTLEYLIRQQNYQPVTEDTRNVILLK